MTRGGLHENLSREDEIHAPTNRNFGTTFAVVFALLAALKLYHGSPWSYVWATASTVTFAVTMIRADLLAPLNAAWLKLGLLLYRVVNPLIMMILFYITILPIGLLMRMLGKDLLRLKKDAPAATYWQARTDDRPLSLSMRQQF